MLCSRLFEASEPNEVELFELDSPLLLSDEFSAELFNVVASLFNADAVEFIELDTPTSENGSAQTLFLPSAPLIRYVARI